jgi:hypothetical protein
LFSDLPENSGLVLTPIQNEFDQFERLILQSYADNWEEHSRFIVRPPSILKPDYELMTDLRKPKVTPLATSLHTATQQAGWGFSHDRLEGQKEKEG